MKDPNMKKWMYMALVLTITVGALSGCKKENPHRAGIRQDIEEMKTQLPMEAGSVTITDVKIEDDLVVYTSVVDEASNMIQADSVLNCDKNYARTIASLDQKVVADFVEAEMGIKYIYQDKTGKQLSVMTMSAAKMKEICDKLKSGEIKPYSILEMSQIEIDQTEYPVKLSDNLWMTEAMVKDNYVINVITLEAKAEKSDISDDEWWETKKNTIAGLQESPLITSCKDEIKEKDIHFSYVYKDVRDTVLTIIDIDYYDLFK